MTYRTMMVRVNALGGDDRLLRCAAEVASQFDVHVIGVSAYPALPQSLHILQAAAGGTISNEQEDEYRGSAQGHIDEAEVRFRNAMAGHARSLAWRSSIVEKGAALGLIQQLRAADLIISNPVGQGGSPGTPKLINVGDLVMNAGRPVLLVPHTVECLDRGTAVVAWKDTRETRRAIRDALPLLSRYQIVTVLEVAPAAEVATARDRVADVVDWLGHHGIVAGSRVETSSGADTNQLAALIRDMGAGLLVAGAYGHARLREWALGGVTEDLLLYPKIPTIMSH